MRVLPIIVIVIVVGAIAVIIVRRYMRIREVRKSMHRNTVLPQSNPGNFTLVRHPVPHRGPLPNRPPPNIPPPFPHPSNTSSAWPHPQPPAPPNHQPWNPTLIQFPQPAIVSHPTRDTDLMDNVGPSAPPSPEGGLETLRLVQELMLDIHRLQRSPEASTPKTQRRIHDLERRLSELRGIDQAAPSLSGRVETIQDTPPAYARDGAY